MKDFEKKAVFILGHTICIFILIYCFVSSKEAVFVSPTPAVFSEELSVIPDVVPAEIITISPKPEVTEPVTSVTPAPRPELTEEEVASDDREKIKQQVQQKIAEGEYAELDNQNNEWWFQRKDNHISSGSGEAFDFTPYQGYYLKKATTEDDKVIYLTLDCGYGSANTEVILDVLKKHDVKVTFFVTKMFLDADPESVRRMVEDGHIVGNHSFSHKELPTLTEEEIYQEIILWEEKFYEITGVRMPLFFRPPEGAYSKRTMQITEDLGYKTIFWSIAYYDYNQNDQPSVQYILDHFEEYHHNGAITLMHNDSSANKNAMDDVITFLKEEGYRFGTLEELP